MKNVYETCVLLRVDAGEAAVKKVQAIVQEVAEQNQGKILLQEDWGMRSLAQPTQKGLDRGQYLYFIYLAEATANAEIERRLRISEEVIKFIFSHLGSESDQESIVKKHVNPFQETNEEGKSRSDVEKERRMFTKKRSCWFTANHTKADWKDPSTYRWLVNEFGKISPNRVSGVSRKHQRIATKAIKQARCIGMIAHTSNRVAQ